MKSNDTDLNTNWELRQITPENWGTIYVVGDIHGCLSTFERLLDRLNVTAEDLVISVGDLVRKGPDSKGVIRLVRERSNIVSVRGNNEQKLIDGRASVPALSESDLSFLRTLPTAIGWGDSLVVHGGVDGRKPLAVHTQSELLNMRSLAPEGGYTRPYWFETRQKQPRVFFGHTVLSEPFVTEWAVGLDTGCVHGETLTAYDCSADRVVSVDATETYRTRPAETIVNPRPAPADPS